jgi:hypothetical protein
METSDALYWIYLMTQHINELELLLGPRVMQTYSFSCRTSGFPQIELRFSLILYRHELDINAWHEPPGKELPE